jgi:hypothetical protein
MIRVIYNTANRVPISLDANGYGPYYLFEIYSEMENEVVKTFVTPDTSSSDNKVRFNEFYFTEVGNGVEDYYGGKISLNNGTYLLRVYQQNSSGSLIPQGDIIYRDVLKVYGRPGDTFTTYNGTDTYTEFL